jgi:3-oxosteroid 1-dehydrogenase
LWCGAHGLTTAIFHRRDWHGRLRPVLPAEVRTSDGLRRIRARAGLLLATGGYDAAPDLVRSFEHLTDLCSMAPATISGDHLRMGAEVGVLPAGKAPASTPIVLGMQLPDRELDGRPMAFGVYACGPGAIFVNAQGARFADETFYHAVDGAYCSFDGRAQRYPNRPAFIVLDDHCRQTAMLGPFAPGEPLPDRRPAGRATASDPAPAV